MKKILCAILAAAMLLSVTGCNVGGSSSQDPTNPDYFSITATGDYSDGIMLPELENANVEIMRDIDWAYLETNNDPTDPFAEYHAILIWNTAYAEQGGEVTIRTISLEQQTDHLATQTASGTAPDIISCWEMTYPRWDAAGLTTDMEQYADYLELDSGIYNLDLMEQYKWAGTYHAIVTEEVADKNYIVYNKTKFEMNGQETPLELWQEGKWTWTQFVKTAKAMTSSDGSDFGFTGWGLFPYFLCYPMAVVNDDGTVSLNIDDSKYMRCATEVYNLYQIEGAARNTGWDLQEWGSLFPYGTDAMVMTDLNNYKKVVDKAAKIDGDTFGIAPVPVFDLGGEEVETAAATTIAYSIASAAPNPIGAAAYLRLETLVTRNISTALEGQNWYDLNLTDEEKEMIEATKDNPILIDPIRGIGDCYLGIIDAYIVPAFYYQDTQESVQAIFDAQKAALQAEIDDFNEMALEAAEEAAALAEQRAAEAEADADADAEG